MDGTRFRPDELRHDLLTRAELAAMIQHVLYKTDGTVRAMLARVMPDAYQRLTGIEDSTLALLLSTRIAELRRAGRDHVLEDETMNNGLNDKARERILQELGEIPVMVPGKGGRT